MNEILQNIAAPAWWFSVVAAGIFINIVSTWLIRWLDRHLIKISQWYRSRSENKLREARARIDAMTKDGRALQHAYAREMRNRIRSAHCLIFSVFCMLLIGWIPAKGMGTFIEIIRTSVAAASALSFFLSYITYMRADNRYLEIAEAEEQIRKSEKSL